MKKMALLCLTASVSASALAETPDVYGRFWLAGTYSDTGLAGNEKVKGGSLENYASYIGMKGKHAISESLNLVYKAEAGIESFDNDASQVFKSRNTYLGLSGNFGEINFGRNDTVFKKIEGGVDQFNITAADMNRLIAGNDRLGDSITYRTPVLSGFQLGASYTPEDDFGGKATLDDANNYALSLVYGDGKLKKTPHYLAVAYADGLNGLTAVRVTAGYRLGQWQFGALYQDSESLVYEQIQGDSWLVSAAWSEGPHKVKAQFGQDNAGLGKITKNAGADLDTLSDSDATTYALGYDYALSKQTTLGSIIAYYDGDYTDASGQAQFEDTLVTVHLKYLF
ncbi:porin [Ferrimonas balearica]|uniref:porin n=1 Tax=Ferrimonas balearica TaxID=44012 RepID=UPI001C9A0E1F|nr:porin [Ferrimonas balearica]MBY5991930.1 porin [Ferrimonas balearica]